MRVAFVHPDLGIGGAERLVVNAAVALQQRGHTVHMFTSHCDEDHCFPECRTQLPVHVYGDWIPRGILGRLYLLFVTVRMFWVTMRLLLASPMGHIDVFFVDQFSLIVPLLRLRAPVLFYCHFPDQLLVSAQSRGSALGRAYRAPFDWAERVTTQAADVLLVNSHFTKSTVLRTFAGMPADRLNVVYPAVAQMQPPPHDDGGDDADAEEGLPSLLRGGKRFLLSINRYEGKKKLELAIGAFAQIAKEKRRDHSLHLVLCGGHDERVEENARVSRELRLLTKVLGVERDCHLLFNVSAQTKRALLYHCEALVYTPPNEHFGMVPLEAMACGKPVIAQNSGGPTESVVHEVTGLLCQDSVDSFAHAMQRLVMGPNAADERRRMGAAGLSRFREKFSVDTFASQVDRWVRAAASV